MCKHAVKKLPYLLRYVSDQYETQQICDKAILENGETLEYILGCFKSQVICIKAVDNYSLRVGIYSWMKKSNEKDLFLKE